MIYIVVILGILALSQLLKVYEYSNILKGGKDEEITESDSRMQSRLMLAFMISFFAFCIWVFFKYKDTLLPEAASEYGKTLDTLLNFNFLIIIIVFFITNFLLFYFASKYNYKKENKATFFAHSTKLELIWTTVPAIVLAVIIIYGLKTWNTITEPIDQNSAIQIELYGKQFHWTARYGGKDNTLATTNYKLITDENPLALIKEDEHAADDILVTGEFHIPVGKMIQFKLRSRDVLHSAFMPHFRAQMNCVPGMETELHFVPTITTKEMQQKLNNPKFNYILLCNKICGAAHYNMQMDIIVESEEDYKKWLATKKTFAQTTMEASGSSVVKEATEVKADSTTTAMVEVKK